MATIEPRLVFGPNDHGRPMTHEEFANAEYLGAWKYERVDGRLVVMSPDSQEHDDCSEPVRDHLGAYRLAHSEIVEQVVSEAWVRVGEGKDRIGDIGVYLATDREVPDRPDRVPEMMFEIVSPGRESHDRDYIEKRAEYARLGVREYVVIDRLAGRVRVYTQTEHDDPVRTLTPADTYTSPLLPGLAIPLSEVL